MNHENSSVCQMPRLSAESGSACQMPRLNSDNDSTVQMSRMSSENGGACQPSRCPDHCGTLPSCAGLAVPYVPFQQNDPKKYAQDEALSNGTLFPGLNLPFHMKAESSSLPCTPLAELQALEFVVLELGIYLDTHSDDMEAFALFKQYAAMEKAAKAAYESKFGPLMKSSAATGEKYCWLQDPWPWDFQQNEVK